MAAIELKKKNWIFVKKYETWFKKLEPSAVDAIGAPADTNRTSAAG